MIQAALTHYTCSDLGLLLRVILMCVVQVGAAVPKAK